MTAARLEPMAVPSARARAGTYFGDNLTADTHWHVHDLDELLLAFDGSIEIETNYARSVLPKALAAWIPAGTVHRASMNHARVGAVFFTPGMVAEPGDRVSIVAAPALMREMMTTSMRWPIDQPDQPSLGQSVFSTMASLCAEWLALEAMLTLPHAQDARIQRAIEATRLAPERATLVDMLSVAGMSERSFRRHFRLETSMTWDKVRSRARISRSIALLEDKNLSIAQVSAAVGFESQSAFASTFAKCMSVSPSTYRKGLIPSL